ncbi:DUF305 family protein family protein [Aquabacterium commune]|jgi:uncharacterized protein (DUF305 family)|uniref:DUF305 family protein family protein n=2 Tax=Burkholderiales TaxID=80840 RepID=A0A4V3CUQ9_9BURK|nr:MULTISPECIES: DUF305 domain-containing protein [Burkholderiales]MCY4746867.1 DUF305 domain-containing protein [Pelomonas sp. UHG3]TDP79578.1 DUF305 family protein family protein [Aquabacterium commune]
MNRSVAALRLALCSTGLILGMSGAATAQSANHGSEQMHKSMMSGMQQMQGIKMTGDTDKDFAMMMKMHHQQALDMAKVQVAHGKSPELKAMAEKMIKDQSKEIAQLEAWLQKSK